MDHKISGVVLTFIDIDILKRREQEITAARDYAVSIVELVREPLLVLDGSLGVRTANRGFCEAFQVSAADTEGRLVFDLGNGQWNIPRLRTLLEELLPQNGHFDNYEVEHDFPGIGQRKMLLSAHRMVQGEGKTEQLILLAIEDITIRKRAQQLQRESQDRIRTMVENAADAIVTIDEMGNIHSVNPATGRMFGYAVAELIGQNVKILMPPPYEASHDGYLARYRQTRENRIIGIGREVQGRHKDGTVFPVDLAVSAYVDQGQHMFSGVLRDLSARKALEREVLEAATLEQQRIGQELHDTSGQELTALGLLAESLVAGLKDQSPNLSRIATKMADGLQRVLGQVRTFARGLIRVELDAQGLMVALAELAAETSELHVVTCAFDCEQPVHLANNQTATQLYFIAREAVTNALKHSNARNITITLESEERSVTLRVRDDGVGLPRSPTHDSGSGLKLMNYRAGLINAHLAIVPAEPHGTTVICTLEEGPHHDQSQVRFEQAADQGLDR